MPPVTDSPDVPTTTPPVIVTPAVAFKPVSMIDTPPVT